MSLEARLTALEWQQAVMQARQDMRTNNWYG
jgi:hypothetical protein